MNKVICSLSLGAFFATRLVAQFGFPPIEPPSIPPRPPAIANLSRFNCQCSVQPKGWRCDQLAGFEDYEWTHKKLYSFALSVISLANTLPQNSFTISIQGISDSKPIKKSKSWWMVSEDCRRKSGPITNEDLALLRACTAAKAIERLEGSGRSVSLLPSIAYKPEEKKIGQRYKAAIIFLLGENGGCKK